MKLEKKEMEIIENPETILSKVDQKRIGKLKTELENHKKMLTTKEYALEITKDQLKDFTNFMTKDVTWKGQESLGIIEINKILEKSTKETTKNGVVYFNNLAVEASHYFLNRWEGKGLKEAETVSSLLKTFSNTLNLIHQDNTTVKDLEKQLAAAEQGITLE
jgi:hypothetical protein